MLRPWTQRNNQPFDQISFFFFCQSQMKVVGSILNEVFFFVLFSYVLFSHAILWTQNLTSLLRIIPRSKTPTSPMILFFEAQFFTQRSCWKKSPYPSVQEGNYKASQSSQPAPFYTRPSLWLTAVCLYFKSKNCLQE